MSRQDNAIPKFARSRNETKDDTELRTDIPKWVMGAIDAESINRGSDCSRKQVVNDVLEHWARQKIHEATVLLRLTEGNPVLPDSAGDPGACGVGA